MDRIPFPPKRRPRSGRTAHAVVAVLTLAICLCLAAATAAQDQLPKILSINPVPDLELVKYDAFGYLDEIRDDAVIIDDIQHSWSTTEEVRFFAEGSSRPVERSVFKVGDLVGCVYDDEGYVQQLWKLKAPPPDTR